MPNSVPCTRQTSGRDLASGAHDRNWRTGDIQAALANNRFHPLLLGDVAKQSNQGAIGGLARFIHLGFDFGLAGVA